MPGSDYYRKQAALCLRLVRLAPKEESSALLLRMAASYQAKVAQAEQRDLFTEKAGEASRRLRTAGTSE